MKQFSKWKSNDQLVVWVVVVLIIQDAKRIHRILFSPLVYLNAVHLFILAHKRHKFVKSVIGRKMCV